MSPSMRSQAEAFRTGSRPPCLAGGSAAGSGSSRGTPVRVWTQPACCALLGGRYEGATLVIYIAAERQARFGRP